MERSALDKVTRQDAATALRSLHRRFSETFRPAEIRGADDTIDPTERIDGGPSPQGLVQGATRALLTLAKALRKAVLFDDPTIAADVFDRPQRDRTDRTDGSLADALAALQLAAEPFAAEVERTPLQAWSTKVHIGDEVVDPMELVKEALATCRGYLNELGPTLEALRRR